MSASMYWPPMPHSDNLISAALRVIQADHYASESDPHRDAKQEGAAEGLALAARELVRAVDALPEAQQPIGWNPAPDAEPEQQHTAVAELAALRKVVAAHIWNGHTTHDNGLRTAVGKLQGLIVKAGLDLGGELDRLAESEMEAGRADYEQTEDDEDSDVEQGDADSDFFALITELRRRIRVLHYSVDSSPTSDGSCIADGSDWPCDTVRALAEASLPQT